MKILFSKLKKLEYRKWSRIWSMKKFYYWTNIQIFDLKSEILNTFLTNSIWLELFKMANCPGKMDWRKFFRNWAASPTLLSVIFTDFLDKISASASLIVGPMMSEDASLQLIDPMVAN